jgi:hypothetical protein
LDSGKGRIFISFPWGAVLRLVGSELRGGMASSFLKQKTSAHPSERQDVQHPGGIWRKQYRIELSDLILWCSRDPERKGKMPQASPLRPAFSHATILGKRNLEVPYPYFGGMTIKSDGMTRSSSLTSRSWTQDAVHVPWAGFAVLRAHLKNRHVRQKARGGLQVWLIVTVDKVLKMSEHRKVDHGQIQGPSNIECTLPRYAPS